MGDGQACTAADVASAIRAVAEVVTEHKVELSHLDREIGDGDHGENLAKGFTAVVAKLDDAVPDTPSAVLKLVASTLISKVGGASGPLFGTAFLRAASAVADRPELDPQAVATALSAALGGVTDRGKAEVGEATMVDALYPAVAAATAAAGSGTVAEVLQAAATAAAGGAASTIPLQARKGRASYLGERSIGHVDPGATSVTYLLQSLADSAASR